MRFLLSYRYPDYDYYLLAIAPHASSHQTLLFTSQVSLRFSKHKSFCNSFAILVVLPVILKEGEPVISICFSDFCFISTFNQHILAGDKA